MNGATSTKIMHRKDIGLIEGCMNMKLTKTRRRQVEHSERKEDCVLYSATGFTDCARKRSGTFERSNSIGLMPSQPEKSLAIASVNLRNSEQRDSPYNHDKQIYDLLRIALHVQDERIRNVGRWCEDDDHLGYLEFTSNIAKSGIQVTVIMKWISRPGKGDLLVGQLDAQNLLPNGNGIPSFASSGRGP